MYTVTATLVLMSQQVLSCLQVQCELLMLFHVHIAMNCNAA